LLFSNKNKKGESFGQKMIPDKLFQQKSEQEKYKQSDRSKKLTKVISNLESTKKMGVKLLNSVAFFGVRTNSCWSVKTE
jgi:hypothetical protein